jgi:hypothetical protein
LGRADDVMKRCGIDFDCDDGRFASKAAIIDIVSLLRLCGAGAANVAIRSSN